MIEWFKMPDYEEHQIWGAVAEPFQYVLSYNRLEGKFYVSAKHYPNASKIIPLGEYWSRNEAEAACSSHWSNNRQ